MKKQIGSRSLSFTKAPFIVETASVVGTKEGEGPLGSLFDVVGADDRFGQNTWEEAESSLQKEAVTLVLGKCGYVPEDVRYVFAGDLLGQTIASSFGLRSFQIPWFGVYGACSTCGEALSLAAMTLAAGYADRVIAVTSSHFASAEKQFRFPLEYANQRPASATWTVTGSGAFLLERELSRDGTASNGKEAGAGAKAGSVQKVGKQNKKRALARITGITTGKIVDYGVKDSMNMGAAMAPAAADTIAANLAEFERKPQYYDRIVTGDLGTVGQEILFDLLMEKGYDISGVHEDCGIRIYDGQTQGTGAGGSGCGCSAATLSAYYLRKLADGKLRRILFVPTGALLSPVSFNEGQSVPGIAHAVVIESA